MISRGKINGQHDTQAFRNVVNANGHGQDTTNVGIIKSHHKGGQSLGEIVQAKNGSTYLDLWAANALQLKTAGVEHIQVSGVCTACHVDDWFSHRAEKGKTGRFGALMALQA
jgi:copper oxidase (laccase) domain-containing protein